MQTNHYGRSPEVQGAFDFLERSAKRAKAREFEGGLNRGVNNSSTVSQLYMDDATCLQVSSEDVSGSITSDMVGKFWFIPDFSRTDGSDVIRP